MSSDLKYWRNFWHLEPHFAAKIQMALVFGRLGTETIVVTNDDKVYAWGPNEDGCLGTESTFNVLSPVEVKVLHNKSIKKFAYGTGHVFALTSSGKVYSWGINSSGQLGHHAASVCNVPKLINQISENEIVIDIACGSNHSLTLTKSGMIYYWAKGYISHFKTNCRTFDKSITGLFAGHLRSLLVTNKGAVYDLIRTEGTAEMTVKELMQDKFSIERLACGYAHTLALSTAGEVYAWGQNDYGQLGLSNNQMYSNPTKLDTSMLGRITDIGAVHVLNMSAAINEEHIVFVWGSCGGQKITKPTYTSVRSLHDAFAYYGTPAVMYKPLMVSADHTSKYLNAFEHAFNDEETSDLVVLVNGQKIYVHEAVLKIQSSYFQAMFQKQWAEKEARVIEHNQFSYTAYKSYLKYLYTGTLDCSPKDAAELLQISDAYMDTTLKALCSTFIKHNICISDVLLMYVNAIEFNAKDLEDYCFNFACRHLTAVIQTSEFMMLTDAISKDFIRKAAQAGAFKT